jgi:hypothetical protein
MVAVNKVKWYLTEAEELLLISKAITDATDKDMFSQAQALYDTILKDYPLMPDKMETVVNIPTIEVRAPPLSIVIFILSLTYHLPFSHITGASYHPS